MDLKKKDTITANIGRYIKKKLQQIRCSHHNISLVVTEAFDIHEVTELRCCDCEALLKQNSKNTIKKRKTKHRLF